MYKILIVEDDVTISSHVAKHLGTWGYECYIVKDFNNVYDKFQEIAPHIVIMDIGLPRYNGYYWCEKIRTISKCPIIFLSSMADNMNIVMAINMGGDDFIPKPFDIQVLTAKIGALIRRTYEMNSSEDIISFKGLTLHKNKTTIEYENKRTELTKNEYKILLMLMESQGNIVTRDELMEGLWNTDSYIDESTLNVSITRLRKQLEKLGIDDYISTKRGMGYQIKKDEN